MKADDNEVLFAVTPWFSSVSSAEICLGFLSGKTTNAILNDYIRYTNIVYYDFQLGV